MNKDLEKINDLHRVVHRQKIRRELIRLHNKMHQFDLANNLLDEEQSAVIVLLSFVEEIVKSIDNDVVHIA